MLLLLRYSVMTMSDDLIISLVPGPATASQDMEDWLRDHGIEANDCSRLEIFKEECIAYQYDRDENGKKFFINKEKKVVAEKEPYQFKRKRPLPDLGAVA